MTRISVLLVDDNPTFLRIATRFLERQNEVIVTGTASGGEEALLQARALQPQVILLDLAMPDLPGLDAIPRLHAILPEAHIIALTLLDSEGYRQAALAAGAEGFVSKMAMNTDLLPAIRRAVEDDQPQ